MQRPVRVRAINHVSLIGLHYMHTQSHRKRTFFLHCIHTQSWPNLRNKPQSHWKRTSLQNELFSTHTQTHRLQSPKRNKTPTKRETNTSVRLPSRIDLSVYLPPSTTATLPLLKFKKFVLKVHFRFRAESIAVLQIIPFFVSAREVRLPRKFVFRQLTGIDCCNLRKELKVG